MFVAQFAMTIQSLSFSVLCATGQEANFKCITENAGFRLLKNHYICSDV